MKKWISCIILMILVQVIPASAAIASEGGYLYELPLTNKQQALVYSTAIEYKLSYELCLAVMAVESGFDTKASNGNCHGLMQLNENTYPALAKQLGISGFDVYQFEHNAQAGILMLSQERDYWVDEGHSDEEVFNAMLISYNRGRAGARRYIEKHGLEAKYVDKVLTYKSDLEQGVYGSG